MKGFGIYVKNDLLDPKHHERMGVSIWLYLWLLDAMTSISEQGVGSVLGGKPIKYEDVNKDLGLSRSTYLRYVATLKEAGYIETKRTPVGLVITVHKAKKIFKKGSVKSDTSQKASDMSKVTHLMSENDTSNKDNTVDNTSITNVIRQKPDKRVPEIDGLFAYWQEVTGLEIVSRRQANRNAASNLIKKHTADGVRRLVQGVALAHGDRYAPRIADFTQLQAKQNELILWGKQQGKSNVEVIS